MTIIAMFHMEPMNNVEVITNMRIMQFLWLNWPPA